MLKFNKMFEGYMIRKLRFMSWIAIYMDSEGNSQTIGWAFTRRGASKIACDHSLTLQYLIEGRS